MDRSIDDGLFGKIVFISVILVLFSVGVAGAVTPVTGCGTLSNAGETYVLSSDINATGTCITIGADNITLDGAGYSITGDGSGYGVYLSGRSGVTVKNVGGNGFNFGIRLSYSSNNILTNNTVDSNTYGISLSSSSNNTITNNTVNSNNGRIEWGDGIHLSYSSNNTITDNTVSNNNGGGIYLYFSNNNTITGNTANSNNEEGIYLDFSSGNTLTNNTVSGNTYNFYVDGSSISHFVQTIDTTNTVDGKPIYYLVGAIDQVIDSSTNAGFIGIINGVNVTVMNLSLTKNGQGVLFVNTTNSSVLNVSALNNRVGIVLRSSSNNTIYNNLFNNVNNGGSSSTNTNTWNTTKTPGTNIIGGPYIGGNFWANPDGYSGYSDTCTNVDGDGICDLNYTLASGNVDHLPLTFTVTPGTIFNITFNLNPGWNLISIPLEQDNWTLTSVLASIEGNYSVVYALNGTWKKSTATRNPLTEMSLEYGYWIYMTAPDTLELSGTMPPATRINVSTGWNLVGYPSLTTRDLTDVLSSINYSVVYAFIKSVWKSSNSRNPLVEMSPGYGYWINANEDGSYEIRN